MRDSDYVHYDNQFHKPRKKKPDNGLRIMVAITAVLTMMVIVLGLVTLFSNTKEKPDETIVQTDVDGSTIQTTGIVIATPTPTPIAARNPNQNPVLYPATSSGSVIMGTIVSGLTPAERGLTQDALKSGTSISPYARDPAIHFGDPVDYQAVPGILTFRGNNFRNCASWGTVTATEKTLEQVWEFNGVGSKSPSFRDATWVWCGVGWTGQALAIQWEWEVQQLMNLYPEKKAKQGLTEIIVVGEDGYVYFLDLDDGQKTRDPLLVGPTIKGTPCVDPRGYPILYVGQGDANDPNGQVGFRIFSLIDYERLYFQNGMDSSAYRTNWGACDSSPIVDAATDTLIYPMENGMIYTLKLNTFFDKTSGLISISPEPVVYRYLLDGIQGNSIGIESSIAIYDHYAYCCDNSGNLICVDLNTMEMVWAKQLDDDSDVSPVLEESNGNVFLYVGTEVDWQRTDVLDYSGAAYTYKINAMTGEEIWSTSQPCYTHNGTTSSDDINGGMLGTPIVGKKSISDLVIFSYCMTDGVGSGNRLVAYNKTTGEEVWRADTVFYSWGSPVDCYDAEGNAYIISGDVGGRLHLFNGSTGEELYYMDTLRSKGTANESAGGNMEASVIIIDNMIIIGTRGGSVFGVKIK
jgi:hypothetical protein